MSVERPDGLSEEFFLRVNDFIEMANRIERRYDTHHAAVAMLHGFSRYAAHHYRATVKQDSEQERADFVTYLGNTFAHMTLQHIAELAGESTSGGGDAGAAASE